MTKYKKCKCDDEYWEEIIVQNDENYQHKTVRYFHCDACGEDFRVEDFETGEVIQFIESKV